jgi:hypothetical protein
LVDDTACYPLASKWHAATRALISGHAEESFFVVLIWLTVITAIVGVVLYFVGATSVGELGQPNDTASLAGGSWLTFSGNSFLASLILGGLLYRAPEARPTNPSTVSLAEIERQRDELNRKKEN